MEVKKFPSSEGNVWKYVFHFDENTIAEAVLYRYGTFAERTVMCVSVQCGCPVGCGFCGTGKQFTRNLISTEIAVQVEWMYKEIIEMENPIAFKKFQIMFMSMGEPMLNWDNVKYAISYLNRDYPTAQLLLSTIGINNKTVLQEIINISKYISKVGLQFSIHQAYDTKRDELIPFKNKLTLREIRNYGMLWNQETGRPVYLNYCIDGKNSSVMEMSRLRDLFPPFIFHFTFSVICPPDETMKDAGFRDLHLIQSVTERFLEEGYNVRVFNPAGQDDIGGGCGQLWYVQQFLNKNK